MLIGFILFFAIANLWSGGKFRPWTGDLPGRSHYYSSMAALALGWGLFQWPGLLAGFSFLLWRLPGWYGSLDAGTNEGSPARDAAVMSLRGLLAFPVFLWALYEANIDPLSDLVLAPLWALLAASLGQGLVYYVGNRIAVSWRFWLIEGMAGAVWGVAYWVVLCG